MHICQHILRDLKKTHSLPNFTGTTRQFRNSNHALCPCIHIHIYTRTHTNAPFPLHTHTHFWWKWRHFNVSDGGQGSSFETVEGLWQNPHRVFIPMSWTSVEVSLIYWEKSLGMCLFPNQVSHISDIRYVKEANFQELSTDSNFHFGNLKYFKFLFFKAFWKCRNILKPLYKGTHLKPGATF